MYYSVICGFATAVMAACLPPPPTWIHLNQSPDKYVPYHQPAGFGLTSCSHLILRQYHYVNLPMNWADAQHYCRLKHIDLATIGSMDDMSRLKRPHMETSLAWIGLSDDPQSWKGVMGNDRNSWRWSATGTTSTTAYHQWAIQPNNYGGKESCMQVYMDGTWNDASCHDKIYFICYTGKTRSALADLIYSLCLFSVYP